MFLFANVSVSKIKACVQSSFLFLAFSKLEFNVWVRDVLTDFCACYTEVGRNIIVNIIIEGARAVPTDVAREVFAIICIRVCSAICSFAGILLHVLFPKSLCKSWVERLFAPVFARRCVHCACMCVRMYYVA